ncbi:hypothetical protein V5799_024880 [Amblyomma americanum]|uniref:Uncharacterized protein n=1 Tax=Amblyomma americanum TaxID=6943 RepID=A0AAQ4EAX0_AMBAM
MGNGCSRMLEDGHHEDAGDRRMEAHVDETVLQIEPPCSGDEAGRPHPSAPDGVFPVVKRESLSIWQACLVVAVVVVILATCYIVGTRLLFIYRRLSADGLASLKTGRRPPSHGTM